MRTPWFSVVVGAVAAVVCVGLTAWLVAQEAPQFVRIQRLTNREVALTLTVTNGQAYRIDTSGQLPSWTPLVTLPSTALSLLHTDSAAPYVDQRFYRAGRLPGTNLFTGDHVATAEGDVVIHPLNHATFL